MSRSIRLKSSLLVAALAGLFGSTALPAQQTDVATNLEARIESARALFQSLDASAAACVAAFEADSSATTRPECREFLAILDGAVVADYLSGCDSLRQWRDDYIATPVPANRSGTLIARDLQRMRDIEFFCGEDALSKRTEHVQSAFNLVRSEQLQARSRSGQSMPSQEYERTLRELRSRAPTVRQERQRIDAETDSLWNELEHELIRQQIGPRVRF